MTESPIEAPRRRRRRNWAPEVLFEIERLNAFGVSAPKIQEAMDRDPALNALGVPGERTIRNIIADLPSGDGSGRWSIADDDGDEIRFLLEVLRHVIQMSNGKMRNLSIAEAKVLRVIAKAAPDLEPVFAYLTARRYVAQQEKKESTFDLDAYLAFQPWVQGGEADAAEDREYVNLPAYQRGVKEGWFENRDLQFSGEIRDFL
jgi:hypothetical protein